MRASNFRQFKKTLPRYIAEFSAMADKDIGDDEWEAAVHRHSASEILVWILNRTGTTLRKSQLVEAWRSIVTKCWNLMDFTSFGENDASRILSEINYRMERSTRLTAQVKRTYRRGRRNANNQFWDGQKLRPEAQVTSDTNGHTVVVPRVTRIRRVATA